MNEWMKFQSNLGRTASPPLTQRIPVVTMGCPTFTPKTAPFTSTISTPFNTPSTDPTHHPKRHPDPISTLSGQTDRPNERQADRWDWRQVCTNTGLRSIDYSDTANYSLQRTCIRAIWISNATCRLNLHCTSKRIPTLLALGASLANFNNFSNSITC